MLIHILLLFFTYLLLFRWRPICLGTMTSDMTCQKYRGVAKTLHTQHRYNQTVYCVSLCAAPTLSLWRTFSHNVTVK